MSSFKPASTIKKKRKRPPDNEGSQSKEKHNRGNGEPLLYGRCDNVWERYVKLGKIGKGTYGVVYKARDKQTNQIVALKRCLGHYQESDGFPLTTLREIQTLRQCKTCPSIVQLRDVAVSTTGVFLVLEYSPHDLAQIVDGHYSLHKKSPFQEIHVIRLMKQLLQALSFLHERNYIHRDLKLSNLLYDKEGELKLADFGLARTIRQPMTPNVVSLWYRPPEVLLGSNQYDEMVDIWGSGCVMAELLLGRPLSTAKTELEQLQALVDLLGPLPKELGPATPLPVPAQIVQKKGKLQVYDLFDTLVSVEGMTLIVTRLLNYLPEERLSASQLLSEGYFGLMPATRMPRFAP